jgi:hypothetical protein
MRACLSTALVAVGVMMGLGSDSAEAATFAGEHTEAAGTRSFRGYVPSGYDPATPLPLVVALHGCSQTGDQFQRLTRFDKLAQARKFVVVYPDQSRDANFLRCWNWFLDAHMHRGAGEPSIIAGITTWARLVPGECGCASAEAPRARAIHRPECRKCLASRDIHDTQPCRRTTRPTRGGFTWPVSQGAGRWRR